MGRRFVVKGAASSRSRLQFSLAGAALRTICARGLRLWGADLALAVAVFSAPALAAAPAPDAPPADKPPIDITADQQEAFQGEQRIVYSGHVQAIQGQDRLRTPRLTIFYTKRAPGAPAPPPGSAGADVGKVKRMEAEGPVFFNNADQNATGDHGVYVAADDTITLTGHVVLTQGKDVSTGDRLVIQQKTHHAQLYTGSSSPRIRSVFYQDETPSGSGAPRAKAPTHQPARAGEE